MSGEVIKGFSIELGLDTLGVDEGLKGLNRTMQRVNSEFSRSLSAFDRGERSLSRYNTTVTGLNSKLEVQKKIVDTNKRAHESLSNEYENNRKALDKASARVSAAEKAMDELGHSTDATVDDFVKAEMAVREAEEAFNKLNVEANNTRKELDEAEISLNKAERDYNNLSNSVKYYTEEMKKMHIEQSIASSNWTKSGDAVINFSNNLEKVSGVATNVGDQLTRKVTAPVLGLITAAGGITAAFGWKRLVGIDNARAQLQGMGYDAEEVERISKQVETAVQGGMMTMAEGTAAAAGALAVGVEEGAELEHYIKLIDAAAVGMNRSVSDTSMIFNRVQGSGRLMTQELNMVEEAMPGFSAAMAEHAGVTLDEFRKMVTEGEVTSEDFLTVMEEFAGGMAEAYAGTWEGMVANTKANIGILGQSLLEGVFQESKYSIEEFLELLRSPAAREWAKETGTVITETFTKVRDAVVDTVDWYKSLDEWQQELIIKAGVFAVAVGPVLSVVGRLGTGIAFLGKSFGGLLKWIGVKSGTTAALQTFGKTASTASVAVAGKAGTGGLISKLSMLAGGFATTGGAVALLSNPITWVVGGLTALAGGFVLAYNKIDWFKNVVDLAWESSMLFFDTINEITGLNALVDWFGDAWSSTEEFRAKVGETAENVTEWITSTFNEKIVEPFENFKAMHREAGETVEVFDEDVSEATQSVLEQYTILSEEATLALSELLYGQQEVTQAQVEDIQEKYKLMNEEAQLKLEERKTSELEQLQMLFDETETLTENERQEVLNRTEAHYLTESDRLNENNERIQQIITEALATEEGLQSHHFEQIQMLQEDHNNTTVTNLTDSEIEQQAILERMTTNQLAMSEETVKQLIADSEEAKNATVSDAAEKRDGIIAEAIRQRDETGTISAEQAQKIIDEAEREYNESVSKAEDRHRDIIAEAAAQASEHGIIVDGETGDILSKWDVFKVGMDTILSSISRSAKTKASEIASSITDPIVSGLNWLITQFNKLPAALGSNFRIPLLGQREAREQNSYDTGYTPIAAYSSGTRYHTGGPALLGDKGPGNSVGGSPSNTREIVELPNQKRYMVDGNVIWPNFPKGAKVKSNKESEPELQALGIGSGSNLFLPRVLTGPTLAGQNKAIEASHTYGQMIANIYDYLENPEKVIETLLSEVNIPGAQVVSEIGGGMVRSVKDALVDKVKALFATVASTGDGSHILGKPITAHFGRYPRGINFNNGIHYGLDTHHVYDSLLSPVNGQVTRTWNDFGGGNSIEIKSGRDYWWFMHLSRILTSVGDSVKAGTKIAVTGNTGNWTTGPHLHTQYMPGAPGNANAKDPLPVLRNLSNKGSFENGGIISSHGYYEGAEGNKPEMVIPLTNRSRAIDLMFQAMSLMGGNHNGAQNNVDFSGVIDKLQRQIELLETNLDNQSKMIEVLLRINMKEFNIGPNDIGPIVDEWNQRQSSIQSVKTGRINYA